MPHTDAFTVRKGQPAVEIGGVGIADDDQGVPLDRAAERMHELQDKGGTPLTGEELLEAAKAWAERVGLQVSLAESPAPARSRKPNAPGKPSGDTDAPVSAPNDKE